MSLCKGKICGITPPSGLYSWGSGSKGVLGNGDTLGRSVPSQVGSASDWLLADAMTGNGYGIRSGKLYAWGPNDYGQIGNGTSGRGTSYSSPVQVGADTTWTKVTGGGQSAAGIKDGYLYVWGQNYSGQLGVGDTNHRSSPTRVGFDTGWTSVACSNYFTLAVRSGMLFGAGYNGEGHLALDPGAYYYLSSFVQVGSDTNWSKVRVSENTCAGLRTDGTLWMWGQGSHGQMGNGTCEYINSSPIQVGSETDWTAVALGPYSVLAIRGGKLFAWGYNGDGILGIGTADDARSSPVQVGSETDWTHISVGLYSAYGIRNNGRLYAWGRNVHCQELGLGGCAHRSSPVQIGSPGDWRDWLSICAGNGFAFATR